MLKRVLMVCVVAASVMNLGCEDPAKNVPKATVDSAKPTTTAAKSAAATGTAKVVSPTATASAAAPTATAAAVAAPPAPDGALKFDGAAAKVDFTGSKVTGKHDGKFEKVSGWLALDEKEPEKSKLFVEIDVASVKSDSEKLDGHLKSPDFFDAEKFPTAWFTVSEIKKGGEKGASHTITGNLKMRGVEKSVSFPATVKLDAAAFTAKAEFAINRKDWGIVYAGKADDLIRDDVVIKLDVNVPRKK